MPFGIGTALGAIGFTNGGIAAGSWAASMMSTAAVANGGAVASGSFVALCQSIGAAGLALGPIGAGAVVIVGGAAAITGVIFAAPVVGGAAAAATAIAAAIP